MASAREDIRNLKTVPFEYWRKLDELRIETVGQFLSRVEDGWQREALRKHLGASRGLMRAMIEDAKAPCPGDAPTAHPSRGFGAQPPPVLAWQVGKTAATIKFVKEAEVEMYRRPDMTNGEGYLLLKYVERLKGGEESLTDWQTVDDWLERLRDHHP